MLTSAEQDEALGTLFRKLAGVTGCEHFSGSGMWTAAAKTLGIEMLYGVNHWLPAIDTYEANHGLKAYQTFIEVLKPCNVPHTNVLCTSPTCVGYTNANGEDVEERVQLTLWKEGLIAWKKQRTPKQEKAILKKQLFHAQNRALIHQIPKFAGYHRYDTIFMENVTDLGKDPEFPLLIKTMRKLKGLHYQIMQCCVNAQFFGAACSRDRAYIVFVREGIPLPSQEAIAESLSPLSRCISCGDMVHPWQDWGHRQSHEFRWGDYGVQYIYRCPHCRSQVVPLSRTARDVLDLSLPMKPVAQSKIRSEKIKADIAEGIRRYGGQPFIHTYNGNANFHMLDEPLPTIMTHDHFALKIPQGPNVADCLHRFPTIPELMDAMTYPPGYILKSTKTDQKMMIGNAVAKQTVEAVMYPFLAQLAA